MVQIFCGGAYCLAPLKLHRSLLLLIFSCLVLWYMYHVVMNYVVSIRSLVLSHVGVLIHKSE